jgi:hypothetical protein
MLNSIEPPKTANPKIICWLTETGANFLRNSHFIKLERVWERNLGRKKTKKIVVLSICFKLYYLLNLVRVSGNLVKDAPQIPK